MAPLYGDWEDGEAGRRAKVELSELSGALEGPRDIQVGVHSKHFLKKIGAMGL